MQVSGSIENRIALWSENYPAAAAYLQRLNLAGVRWGVNGGKQVEWLTGGRTSGDIDITIAADDFAKVKRLSPKAEYHSDCNKRLRCDDGREVHFPLRGIELQLGGQAIEIAATGHAYFGNHTYDFHLTKQLLDQRIVVRAGNLTVPLLPPIYVGAIKAMRQSKHDFSDIQALNKRGWGSDRFVAQQIKSMQFDELMHNFFREAGAQLPMPPRP